MTVADPLIAGGLPCQTAAPPENLRQRHNQQNDGRHFHQKKVKEIAAKCEHNVNKSISVDQKGNQVETIQMLNLLISINGPDSSFSFSANLHIFAVRFTNYRLHRLNLKTESKT